MCSLSVPVNPKELLNDSAHEVTQSQMPPDFQGEGAELKAGSWSSSRGRWVLEVPATRQAAPMLLSGTCLRGMRLCPTCWQAALLQGGSTARCLLGPQG